MKVSGRIYRMLFTPAIIIVLASFLSFDVSNFTAGKSHRDGENRTSGNRISELINDRKINCSFHEVSVFEIDRAVNRDAKTEYIKSAVYLTLNRNGLRDILENRYENIIFKIPTSNDEIREIELTNISVLSKRFQVSLRSKDGESVKSYLPGLYYRGIIKGDDSSLASLSIFKDYIMCIVSDRKGNYVLGPLENNSRHTYVYYNDADMLINNKFRCETDDNLHYIDSQKKYSNNPRNATGYTADSVEICFTADYQMYLDNGSNTGKVTDFITGMFNSVSSIYQNEGIPPLKISQVIVYTEPDPYYNLNSSFEILRLFGQNTKDNFAGDLAHLLSTGHGQSLGGISWINVLCQTYNPSDGFGRFAFSNIHNSYLQYPTYSWTVYLVAHEIGHNFGSRHTHACIWPLPSGGIGAIDSCAAAEGNCFTQTRPNYNGTIMSYCYLNGAVNFIYGFGPLPGDTIRARYNLAECLDSALNSSEAPLTYYLYQNFPNPFNPSTRISFDIPANVKGGTSNVKLIVYDVLGKIIDILIDEKLEAGTYEKEWNASGLSTGVYFYKLQAGDYTASNKMVLLK